MTSRAWKVAQWVLGLLIVLFVARSVAANWDQVRQAEITWRLSVLPLAGGVVAIWLAFALLAEGWRRMVGALGHALAFPVAARVWLLSSMAKYVPGKVWSLAGMAVMARRHGVPAWASAGSALLLQGIAVGTGALLVALLGLGLASPPPIATGLLVALAAAAAAVTGLVFWPPVTRRLLHLVAPEAAHDRVPGFGPAVFGVAANLCAWVGYGVAFWLFARGVLPAAPLGLGESVGAYAASHVAGVLAPFAPAGLGVREGILVLALRDRTGLANALALAAVSRLGSTLAEVAAALPFLLRAPEAARD